jgi:hypothetical protein
MDARTVVGLGFDPWLPLWLLGALAVLALLVCGLALLRRARGAVLRSLLAAVLLLAIANPKLRQENRETLPDIAVLVVDESASMRVGDRARAAELARRSVEERLGRLDNLETRVVSVPEAGSNGTQLFAALDRALAELPRGRLAGVVAITDGQLHDVPENPAAAIGAPFHALVTGARGETDRRVRLIEAPSFGIVGRSVEIRVVVEDLEPDPATPFAQLTERRDGAEPARRAVPVGREQRITVPIERAGPLVVEFEAEARPGEVSLLNNRAVAVINGVRDRLRVLLVSGEPHQGERTWRRLLKADAAVDLVHFTILRPPEKDDLTPLNELALIAFPVRELFQVKLKEFDLIVFDRFTNRGILPPVYLRNIADYVRQGGALLTSVGPDYTGPASLYNTGLGQVLPAAPSGRVIEAAFRPRVTELGQRHPVTAGLAPPSGEGSWGRWYRRIDATASRGQAVMGGPNNEPLLVLDRVGQGRVALMLSDHIWLWSRNHDGGGPQAELLRRIAHWLMKEPDLEEELLRARVEGGVLTVERRSTDDAPPPAVEITAPDGTMARHALIASAPGRATLRLDAPSPGVWRAFDGRQVAFAAAGTTNPAEIADLRALDARLAPVAAATGGRVSWLADGLPEFRRVAENRDTRGPGWMGLRRTGTHLVTGAAELPLLPPWLALAAILGLMLWAWRREGSA